MSTAQTSPFVTKLARFVHDCRFDKLDQKVVAQALLIVRDTLGTMLAASTLPEVRGLADLAAVLGARGQASLIGHSNTTGAHFAALVNGTGAVSLELDEGNQYAINHPSVHIFPAVFALAEDRQMSGADMIAAFIAGYEVAVRVGRATRLRATVHPFGTHAIVGTAAAAAQLLGLDVDQIAQTLELAAGITIASSQTAANRGASVRNLVTGLTDHNGLLAPFLQQAGVRGEPDAFSAVFGHVLGDAYDEDGIGDDLGREYYITRNYFKLYACSRWNHAPIDATARLLAQSPFQAEDVEQIIVWTYDPATRLSGNEPRNGYAAKHSIAYNVAVRVVHGSNALNMYTDEAVQDEQVRTLAKKVVVREDTALTAMLPDVRPARVEVSLRTGTTLIDTVERPRGGFDNPFSEVELLDKFQRLAGMVLPTQSVTELTSLIGTLPDLPDLSALSLLLRTADA